MSRHTKTTIRTAVGYEVRKFSFMTKLRGTLIALTCFGAMFGARPRPGRSPLESKRFVGWKTQLRGSEVKATTGT